jgi:hypothetical protein
VKRLLIAAAALVLAVAFALGWAYRRQALWGSQVRNLELFKSYSRSLEAYRADHGDYPETLVAVSSGVSWPNVQPGNDIWGHPVRYIQRDGHFVLVSGGRDGRADFEDYTRFLHEQPAGIDICLNWNADQILSDQGWHQVCGK